MRLTPQFQALRNALEGERSQLSDSTVAGDPELVAVFDLVGSVDGFLRATQGIVGLEFLAELQEEYVDPDEDFFYEADGDVSEDRIPQSLYMVMTNAQAVVELVRLFDLWQQDQSITFATGLNPLKRVFGLLRGVRRWGPEDRVRETGLLEQWAEDVAMLGARGVSRVEIEFWYRDHAATRSAVAQKVVALVQESGGRVITSTDLPGIAYHAVLADIPMSDVQRVLLDGPAAIALLTTESIMLVSPSRPMSFPAVDPIAADTLRFDSSLPAGRPRVALLDGIPLANHSTLAGRLIIDDPDDMSAKYSSAQRCHGTAMASLLAHGNLSEPGNALAQPIYIRPILEPHAFFPRCEIVPPDTLLVDLIHRAFYRIFEGDGAADPAAPSVRVVNLSVGDPARVFIRRLSPLARLLDWLAHKYNLVIVVSGGNHSTICPTVTAALFDDLDSGQIRSSVARSVHGQARLRRLLSPAEAINVITVGALHDDAVDEDLPDTVVDVVLRGAPASYSPVGFGFRRSVKPEVLLPGGRQIFQAPPSGTTGTVDIEPAATLATGPGIRVASPGLAGGLNGSSFTCGTSNAAALATRTISTIFDVLDGLVADSRDFPFPDPQYHPVIAKTLLVHAASWQDLRADMTELLGLPSTTARRDLTQVLGYGPVHFNRVATADRVRPLLIGAGSIGKDQRHTFRFPLPPFLSASTEWRRLTISLGWLSPVTARSQKYRIARLRFIPPREELAVAPTEADHNAVLKGTMQHQVLEGDAAVAFIDGSQLSIDVDCRVDCAVLSAPVRYALVASLEVASRAQVDLHQQVHTRLRVELRERARVGPAHA